MHFLKHKLICLEKIISIRYRWFNIALHAWTHFQSIGCLEPSPEYRLFGTVQDISLRKTWIISCYNILIYPNLDLVSILNFSIYQIFSYSFHFLEFHYFLAKDSFLNFIYMIGTKQIRTWTKLSGFFVVLPCRPSKITGRSANFRTNVLYTEVSVGSTFWFDNAYKRR